MIYELPKILAWHEFKEVGFYDFISLKECPVKGMSKNLELSKKLPPRAPTKEALLGKLHHRFIELSYNSETRRALELSIDKEIGILQGEVDKWAHLKSGAVSGWKEVNYFAINALKTFERHKETKVVDVLGLEKKLFSSDQILIGRPDLFTIIGNSAKLREFKTSSLFNEEETIRPEYEEQLLFYSSLIFDSYDIETVSCSLESSRNQKFERSVSKNEASLYKDSVYAIISKANEQIKNTRDIDKLTKPTKEGCRTCDKRVICTVFKQRQFSLSFDKDVYILEGELINSSSDKTSSLCLLTIKESFSSLIKSILAPKEVAQHLQQEKSYSITELTYKSGNLSWGEKTQVLSHA